MQALAQALHTCMEGKDVGALSENKNVCRNEGNAFLFHGLFCMAEGN